MTNINRLLGEDEPYITNKIKSTKTIGELNFLRTEIMEVANSLKDIDAFKRIQSTLIKQKNKLKRVPLKDRGTDWETIKPIK